ncbi:MAG: hypothetical protein Q8Q50_06505 [Methylobacter sp.]|nr:hypothetical protein [Methylobacter sp.]
MSETTQLKICPGYPIHLLEIEEPKYEVITLEASRLYGCDLDCALAVSLLTEGTLYLGFLPNGRSYTVRYEAPGQEKMPWSPSSDINIANEILRNHSPSEEVSLDSLREIVVKELGASVDLLRLKRNVA